MSHLIECKQFEAAAPHQHASPCVHLNADKWLSLNSWTTIFSKLDTFVDANLQASRKRDIAPRDAAAAAHQQQQKNIEVNSAPLSYSADWLQLSESKSGQRAADLLLGSIGGAAALDLHTHFVHVRVHRTVEEKSVRQIAQLEEKVRDLKHKLIKATTSSSSSSRSTTVKKSSATLSSSSARRRKSNASATSVKPPKAENCNDDISLASASPPHEEYIPANPVTSSKAAAAPAVKYNPGRMADEPAHEPYVPYVPPETSPAGKATPAYNPSPNSSAEKPGPAATDKRSNRAASKKTDGKPKKSRRKRGYSTDLFESEEELEEQHVVLVQSSSDSTTGLARSARSARTRTAIHSCLDESLLSPRVSPTIKRSKPAAKATDKPPKRDGKKDAGRIRALNVDVVHRTAEPPSAANAYLTKLSDEQMDALSAKRKREMADMQRLRELLKPEPLPDIQVVDLKDTSLTEIEGTFAAHQPRLLAFFEAYCGGRMRQIVRPADMSEFAVNYLLNEQQQLHMVDILTKAFGGQENLSSYTELFWKLLLPEWSVALFMDRFSMKRPEATERMRQQEKIVMANFRMDDTMDDSLEDDYAYGKCK